LIIIVSYKVQNNVRIIACKCYVEILQYVLKIIFSDMLIPKSAQSDANELN